MVQLLRPIPTICTSLHTWVRPVILPSLSVRAADRHYPRTGHSSDKIERKSLRFKAEVKDNESS